MESHGGTTAERTMLAPNAAHLGALVLAAECAQARVVVEARGSYLEMFNAALRFKSGFKEREQAIAEGRAMQAMKRGGAVVWVQVTSGPGQPEASLQVLDKYYSELITILKPPDC